MKSLQKIVSAVIFVSLLLFMAKASCAQTQVPLIELNLEGNLYNAGSIPNGDLDLHWTGRENYVEKGYIGRAAGFNKRLFGSYIKGKHPELSGMKELTVACYVKMDSVRSRKEVLVHLNHAYSLFVGKKIRGKPYVSATLWNEKQKVPLPKWSAPGLNDGKWHHIMLTTTGTHAQIYVDGEKIGERPFTGSIRRSSEPLYIGRKKGIRSFKGTIDEVKIYPEFFGQQPKITHEFFGLDFNLARAGEHIEEEFQDYLDVVKSLGISSQEEGSLIISADNPFPRFWGKIEPEPPVNGEHRYTWENADILMRMIHDTDKRNKIEIQLVPQSLWGTEEPLANNCCKMSPPKDDATCAEDYPEMGMTCWEAWEDFVYNLVERYDGDGINDAPGITRPMIEILSVGTEEDCPSHWSDYGGTPGKFKELIEKVQAGIERADSDLKANRGNTNPGAIFDNNPDYNTASEIVMKHLPHLYESLMLEPNYDKFAINFNYHYTGLGHFIDWLKWFMTEEGYEKRFIVPDVMAANRPLGNPSDPFDYQYYKKNYIGILGDPAHPLHEEFVSVYRADQARVVVKKASMALSQNEVDFFSLQPSFDGENWNPIWWKFAGLIDVGRYYEVGLDVFKALKPVYYAYKQFIEKVVGADREVERLDLGNDNIWAYKFMKEGKPIIVIWHENIEDLDLKTGLIRRNQEVTVDLMDYFSYPEVKVTKIVTEIDSQWNMVSPEERFVYADSIVIDETPVYVEEQ